MENMNEQLKYAIVNNDSFFLRMNKSEYDINHRFIDEDNDTLLLYALSDIEKKNDIYLFLLENGADINLVNDKNEGIIHSIVYSGISKRLTDLIERSPKALNLINSQAKDGTTPLLLSVLLENYDMFNSLLELGADVNLSDYEGNMPIHPACFLGYKDMVDKLVEKGANLYKKTLKGNYPLALAVNGEHDEIVNYLYKKIYL